jgi:triosephosphate isomerase
MLRSTSLLKSFFSRNRRLIAGNWKSNFTLADATNFVKNTINTLKYDHNNVGNSSIIQMLSSLQSISTSQLFLPSIQATIFPIG